MNNNTLDKIPGFTTVKANGQIYSWRSEQNAYVSSDTASLLMKGDVAVIYLNDKVISVGDPISARLAFKQLTNDPGIHDTTQKYIDHLEAVKEFFGVKEWLGKLKIKHGSTLSIATLGQLQAA